MGTQLGGMIALETPVAAIHAAPRVRIIMSLRIEKLLDQLLKLVTPGV